MLVATFAGNAICCLFLFLKLRIGQYFGISNVDKTIVKDELKYSVPLVPNQLSLWVMNSSDRLIVTFCLGAAANGILAVSHKFPSIYMTFFNIFQLAWHETGAIHYFDDDRDQFFTDMIKKILGIFSTMCMGVIVVLPLAFNWFVDTSYSDTYYNIPVYLVASLFNVIIGLLGVVYVATRKTKEIAKTTLFAAVINIVVNICLIKFIGLYAASISTLVGYFVTLIYRIIDTKKYLKIKYDIKQIFGIAVSVIMCCIIYYLNNKVVSILFLPAFIVLAYVFNKDIVDGLLEIVSERTSIGKKKIMMMAVCGLVLITTIIGFIVFKEVSEHPKEIQTTYEDEIMILKPEKVISFADFGSEDFTCTGFTYDSLNNTYWIGDYGALDSNTQAQPRLVEVDKDFNEIIREIKLTDVLDSSANLQGVAYDRKDDCLWLAIGKSVVAVSRDGRIVRTIDMGEYAENKSNGICYNEKDDTLWVLCASQYLLHYKKDGTLLEEFSFNYADQDHICIVEDSFYITVGADYKGINNYICEVSIQDGSIISLYRTEQANALEGICYEDGKVMIVNDGLYHNDVVGISYFTVYDGDGF